MDHQRLVNPYKFRKVFDYLNLTKGILKAVVVRVGGMFVAEMERRTNTLKQKFYTKAKPVL